MHVRIARHDPIAVSYPIAMHWYTTMPWCILGPLIYKLVILKHEKLLYMLELQDMIPLPCHGPLLYMLELLYIDTLPCLDASLAHWSTNLLLKNEPGIQTWNREFKLWFLVFEFPGNQKPRIKFGTGNSHFDYLLLNSREVWIIGVWCCSGASQGARSILVMGATRCYVLHVHVYRGHDWSMD